MQKPVAKKQLIINADDAGFSDPINEAVKACYLGGKITGASLMACGDRFKEAASMLREIGKNDVGVHFTLTGKLSPCVEDKSRVATLVNKDGRLAADYKIFALRYLLGRIDLDQVYLELKTQIKRVLDEGLAVTHFDSHENVHMFPDVFDVTKNLAEEFKVPYVRMPVEPSSIMLKGFSIKDFVRRSSLIAFASKNKKRIGDVSFMSNDIFLGHFHAGRMDYDIFFFMMNRLGEGISELAVHPSILSEDFFNKFPWYKNAEKEFDFLINEDWKGRLDALGVRLVTHREAVAN
ncbi:MAG: carbohydrate deacetylase [Candidatus Omnitrophota bacterium]